jgi:hypothetical protein
MTPPGIEPATFRLIAQCLNQLHHHVPPQMIWMYSNEVTDAYVCFVVFKLAIINHFKLATAFIEVLFMVSLESR